MTSPSPDATPTPCQHDGCTLPGFECRDAYHDEVEFPAEYYCGEHAAEHGYCAMCGSFSAGICSFDWIHPGYCDNCWDEVRAEEADDEDDDEFPPGLDDVEDPEY